MMRAPGGADGQVRQRLREEDAEKPGPTPPGGKRSAFSPTARTPTDHERP